MSHMSFSGASYPLKKVEPLEGVVGSAGYEGPAVGGFLPLLCLGQLSYVGRRAVFGLGKYRLS